MPIYLFDCFLYWFRFLIISVSGHFVPQIYYCDNFDISSRAFCVFILCLVLFIVNHTLKIQKACPCCIVWKRNGVDQPESTNKCSFWAQLSKQDQHYMNTSIPMKPFLLDQIIGDMCALLPPVFCKIIWCGYLIESPRWGDSNRLQHDFN